MQTYDLRKYEDKKGNILFEVNKTLWGLPQAGILSRQRLCTHLASHGYHECPNTPGLFWHETRNVSFVLVVDDFLVKFQHKADAQHLIDSLTAQGMYAIRTNDKANKFLGFHIDYNKTTREICIDLHAYIAKMLVRHYPNGPPPRQKSPAVYKQQDYGKPGPQFAEEPDSSPRLPDPLVKHIQKVVGSLLYFAVALDTTILPAVTAIASAQAHPTRAVLEALDHLVGYVAYNQHNKVVFRASSMRMHCATDVSHQSRPGSRGVAAALFYCGDSVDPSLLNGAIDAYSSLISVVTASVAETEYAGVFLAAQRGAGLRTTLSDLKYPQPETIIFCDNSCAVGLASDTVKAKRFKAIDMRFHWVRDRIKSFGDKGQLILQIF